MAAFFITLFYSAFTKQPMKRSQKAEFLEMAFVLIGESVRGMPKPITKDVQFCSDLFLFPKREEGRFL